MVRSRPSKKSITSGRTRTGRMRRGRLRSPTRMIWPVSFSKTLASMGFVSISCTRYPGRCVRKLNFRAPMSRSLVTPSTSPIPPTKTRTSNGLWLVPVRIKPRFGPISWHGVSICNPVRPDRMTLEMGIPIVDPIPYTSGKRWALTGWTVVNARNCSSTVPSNSKTKKVVPKAAAHMILPIRLLARMILPMRLLAHMIWRIL
mmetsp:Transcript_29682/g.33270  ORF Transcript_29682/g.33270 Transcript_29682/m.33270 type:complete len:202 (+) Transcript_29682:269-874(+)